MTNLISKIPPQHRQTPTYVSIYRPPKLSLQEEYPDACDDRSHADHNRRYQKCRPHIGPVVYFAVREPRWTGGVACTQSCGVALSLEVAHDREDEETEVQDADAVELENVLLSQGVEGETCLPDVAEHCWCEIGMLDNVIHEVIWDEMAMEYR